MRLSSQFSRGVKKRASPHARRDRFKGGLHRAPLLGFCVTARRRRRRRRRFTARRSCFCRGLINCGAAAEAALDNLRVGLAASDDGFSACDGILLTVSLKQRRR